jgi:hypothetical protein
MTDYDEEEEEEDEIFFTDERSASPPVIPTFPHSGPRALLRVQLPKHSPEAVMILLEYCYTNRVICLGWRRLGVFYLNSVHIVWVVGNFSYVYVRIIREFR